MRKEKLIVIGNGMAGVRCVEEIISNDPTRFEIYIFGSERHLNYNRILLSSVLQGDASINEVTLNTEEWYKQNQIYLYIEESVIGIDKENKTVKTDKNRIFTFDKLIIATGSKPFILPLPGNDLEGVLTFRTIDDCEKILKSSVGDKKAVVIGGGVLGLEAARGLLNLGMDVSVVHNSNVIMERQLDLSASKMLQQALERQGMKFLLDKKTEAFFGNERVQGIRFKDGSIVETDLVIMAVGVRPNIELAKLSGIETNRAIIVNDRLETSIKDIYAVGECVEHQGNVYGLVKPLYEQGRILAKQICGMKHDGYKGSVLTTQLKVSGVEVFSVGDFQETDSAKSITLFNEETGVYKKVVLRNNKLIGAVLYGDTTNGPRLLDLIKKKIDVSTMDEWSLLQSIEKSNSSILEMSNSSVVCNCNNVTKGMIIESITRDGLETVEQVKKCTRASSSCGSCKPLVKDILDFTKSPDHNEVYKAKTLCSCTSLSEEEVVTQIQLKSLTSINEVFKTFNWKSNQGCRTCRPALNYYFSMIYPEYETEQETIFINKNKNAFIQKDGTYTIIPQMYGGLTNGEQLQTIGRIVQKYSIPHVAITSEQRIQIMGVQKKDLENVWNDLNMSLSLTYGSTVRNVKTCIGENKCKCDKDKALNIAVAIEETVEFLKTPYQMKLGVSACIHNGAGSTTKDIGVIGIDRGWEIYIGGSSGRNVHEGELLCVVQTELDAIKMITSLIQYYRETANYLERSWQWITRLGLIHIREVLFDQELCEVLQKRLEVDKKYLARKMDFIKSNY
ncbi:nitrite reductase large subunit NirB [Litchfieldia salsa]|uniref:Nitrite reductase (NADH) large subunit n=1 Tax=Litchfieldia salsa TaxID=930152 RepID=A0A1H0RX35_9BACI|nr:nitrite reductase large subunit NirB [Litchfieldia salsa]SDP33576.1 nitrite reductase (NADH) large subunit [Litchfieldia salsa]